MKKIILITILFFNIMPSINKKGQLKFVQMTGATAQGFGNEDPDDGELCILVPELCEPDDPDIEVVEQCDFNDCNIDESCGISGTCFEGNDPCETDPTLCGYYPNDGWEDWTLEDVCEAFPDLCYGFDDDWQDMDWPPVDYYDDPPPPYDFDYDEWFYSGGDPEEIPDPPYYVLLTSYDTYRTAYRDGSQFSFVARPGAIVDFQLKPHNSTVTDAQIKWVINGTTKCVGTKICTFDVANAGTFNVSAQTTSGQVLISFKLLVFGKSIVVFDKANNWDGEYGFDNEGYTCPEIAGDYTPGLVIENKPYKVPWMSVLEGPTNEATIKVRPFLTATNAASSSYWVKFVPSSSKITITINGTSSSNFIQLTGSQLSSVTTMKVQATELDANASNFTKAAIDVVNSSGETIGRLFLSCQKRVKKKLVVVYVKENGSNYPAKFDYANYLNTKSHNQIFKEWELQSLTAFPDELDLGSEYADHPTWYAKAQIHWTLTQAYRARVGPDPQALNKNSVGVLLPGSDPNRIYFIFLTDISVPGQAGAVSHIGEPFAYVNPKPTNQKWTNGAVSHEMGHALNLIHTFKEGNIAYTPAGAFRVITVKNSTQNIMDYAGGMMLYYFQWKYSY